MDDDDVVSILGDERVMYDCDYQKHLAHIPGDLQDKYSVGDCNEVHALLVSLSWLV